MRFNGRTLSAERRSPLFYHPHVLTIADRIIAIHERIKRAVDRAGRNASDVTLMAVTKTQPATKIIEAYEAGLRSFGENRVQEFAAKRDQLTALEDAEFALIGALQSNKVNKAAELFSAIHSVDSLRLAERINSAVERSGRDLLSIAIEINAGDSAKAGMAPDSDELDQLLQSPERFTHLRIEGLMTIPPFTDDPEGARPYFRKLRELRDTIAARRLPGVHMDLLSMGMSHDFEIAIEEGSTCVRVGTAIFGERS
jgi:pyridoxal phosphate enzyme (YggS family)